ncbi:MAG: cupin domain-containing protein [Nitrososphaeria archaeon]|nr:cupin domain-containing protein [Nitrososphaeria archaeon]
MLTKILNSKKVRAEKILGGPIKPLISNKDVSMNQEFALGIFRPKQGLYFHKHPNSEEIYYVISGKGTVFIGNERDEIKINEGDVLYIPANTPHGVTNTGRKRLIIAFFVSPGKERAGYDIGKDCEIIDEKILYPTKK